MNEARNCQNCKNQFVIEPEDFDFYGKMQVPPPTFCPECRRQRRMAFLNFTHLHKRKCDLCGKDTISKYPADAKLVVYCVQCFHSDQWDPLSYGRDYDFSRPFFEQFSELLRTVPVAALDIDPVAAKASPFTNHAGDIKDCYLVFFAAWSEDCLYGFYLSESRSLLDFSLAAKCDFCYDSDSIFKNNKCIGVLGVTESFNCTFLRDSTNCQDCFGSANLRNKRYYIWNQPYTKEEYEKEIAKYDLGSYRAYQELKRRAEEHWRQYPPKPVYDELSIDSTGNYVFESKNAKECYEVTGAVDSKYLMMMLRGPVTDCYDVTGWGDNISRAYESYIGTNVSDVRFCLESNVGNLRDAEYSVLSSSEHLFGCVSARQARYCILNKPYSEEEYAKLRKKIVDHMNDMPYVDRAGRTYRYGEFFPIEISWASYNETLAQIFFPLTKEKATKEGYAWREPEASAHAATKQYSELPDHIRDAGDDLLKEAIACESCSRPYRVLAHELQLLRAMNLPLPRRCPLCRINGRIERWSRRLSLVERSCSRCSSGFRTPYSEADAPSVLCKPCYIEATS